MDLKPIVPGCRAVIVRGKSAGLEVIAIERLGDNIKVPCLEGSVWLSSKDIWKINTQVAWSGGPFSYCEESRMLRIDGNEELFKAEAQSEKLEGVADRLRRYKDGLRQRRETIK